MAKIRDHHERLREAIVEGIRIQYVYWSESLRDVIQMLNGVVSSRHEVARLVRQWKQEKKKLIEHYRRTWPK